MRDVWLTLFHAIPDSFIDICPLRARGFGVLMLPLVLFLMRLLAR